MIRTDLALEAKEMYHENAGQTTEIDGVVAHTNEYDDISVTTVEILNEKGERALGKPVGKYITIEMPKFKDYGRAFYEIACNHLKECISEVIPKNCGKCVLVTGLGNRQITPDALGPKVIDKLIVSRHLHELAPDSIGELGCMCALSPGVLGITGIETLEIIKGVAGRVKPDLIIAIDALCSRQADRVATTIQIANTGISPGSGIGNNRKGINEETLGIPVIAIGVPMVVDAETIAYDAVCMAEGKDVLTFDKIKKAVRDNVGPLLVTPKDIDRLTEQMSDIVAGGINTAFHNIKLSEIPLYIY